MHQPESSIATSMSWIIVEIMNWIACRIVFAADQLIPTLRWSQITSTQTILMINSVEIETSRILLAESGRWFFSIPFGESGAWGCLGMELEDAGCFHFGECPCWSHFSCSWWVCGETSLPGCSIPAIITLHFLQHEQVHMMGGISDGGAMWTSKDDVWLNAKIYFMQSIIQI